MRAGQGGIFLWVWNGWEQAVDPLEQNEEWAKEKSELRNGKEQMQQLALQMCW